MKGASPPTQMTDSVAPRDCRSGQQRDTGHYIYIYIHIMCVHNRCRRSGLSPAKTRFPRNVSRLPPPASESIGLIRFGSDQNRDGRHGPANRLGPDPSPTRQRRGRLRVGQPLSRQRLAWPTPRHRFCYCSTGASSAATVLEDAVNSELG